MVVTPDIRMLFSVLAHSETGDGKLLTRLSREEIEDSLDIMVDEWEESVSSIVLKVSMARSALDVSKPI